MSLMGTSPVLILEDIIRNHGERARWLGSDGLIWFGPWMWTPWYELPRRPAYLEKDGKRTPIFRLQIKVYERPAKDRLRVKVGKLCERSVFGVIHCGQAGEERRSFAVTPLFYQCLERFARQATCGRRLSPVYLEFVYWIELE